MRDILQLREISYQHLISVNFNFNTLFVKRDEEVSFHPFGLNKKGQFEISNLRASYFPPDYPCVNGIIKDKNTAG